MPVQYAIGVQPMLSLLLLTSIHVHGLPLYFTTHLYAPSRPAAAVLVLPSSLLGLQVAPFTFAANMFGFVLAVRPLT